LAGGFAASGRLPATRTLARELGVSRTTVIEAFDRLTSEGLVESRVGAGTYVTKALEAAPPKPPATARARIEPPRLSRAMARSVQRFGERSRLPAVARAFTTALPAFDAFPMAQWARLSAKHWRRSRSEVMGYGEALGHCALRQAIAAHLRANRGIGCDAAQIFIVAGAQQAFSLIAAALLNPGDPVWFENPGAIGARNSLIAAGAELVPVPVDDQGLRVEEGLRRRRRFRLAFVTPSHQQPLGVVMSLERRFALLKAAQQARAWVIEDDYDGEFPFGGAPLPTLKSVDTNDLVIYVGTFSKSLFPSLRLGYFLAPAALTDTFGSIMSKVMQGVPTFVQAVVAEFIDEGHFASHLRRMRRTYAERHEALCAAARARLGGLLDVVPSHSGLHTIGHLRRGLVETAVADAARARDVTVSPIGRFCLTRMPSRGLVLGFGGVPPADIEAGVRVLGEVLERQARGG
ncbi:MAG: PLP-dependent aminotransferase family protein, partial [Burkholderiales bacterium]|nr:PLP-dependent aminotransferase family protein [Burkholderiales bacterium]